MIVVLKLHASKEEIREVEKHVADLGYAPHTIRGEVRTVVAAVGDETTHQSLEVLEALPSVERVVPIQKRYKLVSREAQEKPTTIRVGPLTIGEGTLNVIAGPCSVESLDQMMAVATAVRAAGATILRGGAFKPRTSPYDFQGLGEPALEILATVRERTGMPIISEVLKVNDIESMKKVVDIFQIGARNAMNYALLEAVAGAGKPVFLKRGLCSTIEEWLLAAEYLAKNGNPNVILCERGIRTYETATRNTLDISAVAVAKLESNLPVFVDPSHAAGRRDVVTALARAAIAVGADGLMVEVHNNPEEAYSDRTQQLTTQMFSNLMRDIQPYVKASGKKMARLGATPGKARTGTLKKGARG
jgi:3-deoxy-7-phosphoheptulonate synthase